VVGQKGEEMKEMTTINVYAVIKGVTRIWLSLDVEKEKAREMGSGYAALAVATDPRVDDAWWDYVDNLLPKKESDLYE
jgi:hypothetical protein